LHANYVTQAGGVIENGHKEELSSVPTVEISPLLSYAGENLEEIVGGKQLIPPIVLAENAEISEKL